jgi:hypothetical protein
MSFPFSILAYSTLVTTETLGSILFTGGRSIVKISSVSRLTEMMESPFVTCYLSKLKPKLDGKSPTNFGGSIFLTLISTGIS